MELEKIHSKRNTSTIFILPAVISAVDSAAAAVNCLLRPVGLVTVVNQSGHLTFTKSALDALSELSSNDSPSMTFLYRSAQNLHNRTGDGVKSFIVMLESLFHSAKELEPNQLLQLRALFCSFCSSSNKPSSHLFDYNAITTTFFRTRLFAHVAEKSSRVFTKWVNVNKHLACENEIYRFLFEYSDTLVVVKNSVSSINKALLKKGLFITGKYYGKHPNFKEKYLIFSLYIGEDNEGNNHELLNQVYDILLEINEFDYKNVLIISNCQLPPKPLQLLSKYCVFTNVPSNAVSLIRELLLLKKRCSQQQWVEFSFLDSRWREMTVLIDVHTFFCTTPSHTLSRLYIKTIKDCLRLCQFSAKNHSILLECGKFEKYFSFVLAATYGDEWISPVVPTSLLDEWSFCVKHIKIYKTLPYNGYDEVMNYCNVIMESLKDSNVVLDQEVVVTICQFLLDTYVKFNSSETYGFEPLSLKYEIILSAINTFCTLANIDGFIVKDNLENH